jgi:hypothetical protein
MGITKSKMKSLKRKYSNRKKVRKKVVVKESCYDLYCKGDRGRNQLCPNCINYLDLNPKRKPQPEMGVRFYQCHGPKHYNVNHSEVDSPHSPSVQAVQDTPKEAQSDVSFCCVTDSANGAIQKKRKISPLSTMQPNSIDNSMKGTASTIRPEKFIFCNDPTDGASSINQFPMYPSNLIVVKSW